MKTILAIITLLLFVSYANANSSDITNETFKQYLIDRGYDTNGDNEISTAEAEAITELDLDGSWVNNITTIEGIEKLINLEKLTGKYWDFTAVDVTSNTKLKHLSIATSTASSTTGITSLNVSTCVDLEFLLIYADLAVLDLTNNTKLKHLNIDRNKITNIDFTNNVDLTYLSCVSNEFTAFDITNNVNLDTLRCGSNDFSTIGFDISANTNLI